VLTASRLNAAAPMVEQVVVALDGDLAGIGDHDWWLAARDQLAPVAAVHEAEDDPEDDEEE